MTRNELILLCCIFLTIKGFIVFEADKLSLVKLTLFFTKILATLTRERLIT